MKFPFLLTLGLVLRCSTASSHERNTIARTLTQSTPANPPKKPPPKDVPEKETDSSPDEATGGTPSTTGSTGSSSSSSDLESTSTESLTNSSSDFSDYGGSTSAASVTSTKVGSSTAAMDSQTPGIAYFDQSSRTHSKAPLLSIVGAMAALVSLFALVTARRRRIQNDGAKHPLKGSVQNRMNLFSALADPNESIRRTNDTPEVKMDAMV